MRKSPVNFWLKVNTQLTKAAVIEARIKECDLGWIAGERLADASVSSKGTRVWLATSASRFERTCLI